MDQSKRVVGFIGGSGLYDIPGLNDRRETSVETPWGTPSAAIVQGVINGVDVAFLARHGTAHDLTPDAVNYRANIAAMKHVGVTDLISISACGSFKEELAPGDFVLVDQYIDRTSGRVKTFFDEGCVVHASLADPACPTLLNALETACETTAISHHRGGVYLAISGPQFSTRAESHLYRSWNCDVIGMTNMPEAKLAREAELPYVSVAMVTDYDCWRENEGPVDVASVLAVMKENTEKALRLIPAVLEELSPRREPSPLGIETNLDFAIITPPQARSAKAIERLAFLAPRLAVSSD